MLYMYIYTFQTRLKRERERSERTKHALFSLEENVSSGRESTTDVIAIHDECDLYLGSERECE